MDDGLRKSQAIVIGAGASGVLVAVHFQRAARPGARLTLVEAGARAARGLAYGTPYGAHLLNVPAGKMSALVDQPDHFLRWLQGRLPGADAGTFAPRTIYGNYLADLLEESRSARGEIVHVGGTAVGLTRQQDSWVVHMHDGRPLHSRHVVLALGNLLPADPLRLGPGAPAEYLRDPWAPGAALGLASDAEVLFIGTGLTMVDLALSLRIEGHQGRLHAISRHGRLPQAHAAAGSWTLTAALDGLTSPLETIRWLRAELRAAESGGSDWRAVVDALRPHISRIWRQWSPAGRASFLRHARSLWDVHRHRMAPEVAQRLDALRAHGTLTVYRGRILELRPGPAGIDVRWRPARAARTRSLTVARVVNCTGPAGDYSKVDLPLVVEMRRAGWLVPDALGLGVETDTDGRLLGRDGRPVPGLWTLGAMCRPALWESTAIPELRAQAYALASSISAD